MSLTQGYNLYLKECKLPEGFSKMSIIQFLRFIETEQTPPPNAAIFGLDTLLISSDNPRECVRYIMSKLRMANKSFRKNNNTFLFIPQNDLYENSDIYCKVENKKVSISAVFASRLQISDVGVYHAEFEF